jgi:hypothetical protein
LRLGRPRGFPETPGLNWLWRGGCLYPTFSVSEGCDMIAPNLQRICRKLKGLWCGAALLGNLRKGFAVISDGQ